MKKRRKLVAMAGAAVLALSLTACGSISLNLGSEKSRMEGYVQGYLDLTYLGKLNKDYQTEMELSEEEAQQQYEEGIQVEVEFFESGIGLIDYPTEEITQRLTELYKEIYHEDMDESLKMRLDKVVHRIDGATLLFFLGILLAVDVLRYVGILNSFSTWLDTEVGNVYIVNLVIGTLSAIVDNVPLVAGAMGMYPIATEAMVANSASAGYLMNFMQDGIFWQFLAYCAGVGGSMLIIGSAAGVVVMGLEGINFIWYLKRISWVALAGYLAGALVYIGQNMLIG